MMRLTQKQKIRWGKVRKKGRKGMKTVRRLRAMASLCRQSAAYHPDRSWNLLAEAEYWDHLADGELLELYKECTGSSIQDGGVKNHASDIQPNLRAARKSA